jgi:hypothetical protein
LSQYSKHPWFKNCQNKINSECQNLDKLSSTVGNCNVYKIITVDNEGFAIPLIN